MSLISFEYLVFFVVVVAIYFALPHRVRWAYLLAASYFFYMWMDPKYAVFILTTTVIVYVTAIAMHGRTPRIKKMCVALSAASNLGILFVFKYYNFFNAGIKEMLSAAGLNYSVPALNLLLPVGISFYTFQALGYTIDVYRGTREPERHFGVFALFVSFFPVLLSGPIERSTTLMPQLWKKVDFNYDRVTDGLKLMAWGFFQKLVIADRLAVYVNLVYNDPQKIHGLPLLLATYFFAVQIYCDFSGYTDIAIGTAQVMGYDLIPNFRRPFYAPSIAELWRRWHMSLISWLRDYLYIPLGGNRVHRWRLYFNIMIVFTMSGLWHGAQWTLVAWGALNGVLIVLGRVTLKLRDRIRGIIFGGAAKLPAPGYFIVAALFVLAAVAGGALLPRMNAGMRIAAGAAGMAFLALGLLKTRGAPFDRFLKTAMKLWMIFVTFQLFTLGAVFFRSRNMSDAWYILTHFPGTNLKDLKLIFSVSDFLLMAGVIVLLNVINLLQERGSVRQMLRKKPLALRWSLYYLLVMSIIGMMYKTAQFIYFQF